MSDALDRFFEHYYRCRPVSATFTGVHTHDDRLPDWSPSGLESLGTEMYLSGIDLTVTHPPVGELTALRDDVDALDAELARAFLDVQVAEQKSGHGVRGNPALWSGEAIFAIISLMIRDFAPLRERMPNAAARLDAIPGFLTDAATTLGDGAIPAPWTARALRECDGAAILLGGGIDAWIASAPDGATYAAPLRPAADRAAAAFTRFADWLRARPAAPESEMACGEGYYDLLLARGHWCMRPRAELLADAYSALRTERARLDAMVRTEGGSWAEVQARLAADHPAPDDYLAAFARTWEACRAHAESHDVVTWPDWPIRYVPFPAWTRDAAPYLYYLYYRSPAPFDPYTTYDYVVPPLPNGDAEAHLRVWNHSAITLNHVVHHGAVGHHVQNWHAYHRAPSRIAKIAAVDCASRIAMLQGGTLAEGWACYATAVMDESGFLTPLQQVSEQHSRLRFLVRAIIDVELHQGRMSFDDAVRFWAEQTGMSADAGRAEVTKASMFPGTAIMYWIGTQGILDLREAMRARQGAAFSLRDFHDALLGYGAIPVPLIARLMTEDLA